MAEWELPGSFRDPSGFLFVRDNTLFRQINHSYKDDYDFLMGSHLYDALIDSGLLIAHQQAADSLAVSPQAYKIIQPDVVGFISYPYEWCFSQLKDAALATLEIQKKAIEHGMSLKDASAYNIQFHKGRAVFIDTLSFERYRKDQPWVAYRQFCQHFLAPLALMARKDIRLGQLLRIYIDGIPLDLADELLGIGGRFSLSLLLHIHLHAKSQKRHEDTAIDASKNRMSRFALLGLIDGLHSAVRRLKWNPTGTQWSDYYSSTNYSSQALDCKKKIVAEMLKAARPGTVWDIGANTGLFSRLASEMAVPTVAFDIDPAAVETNYRQMVAHREVNILPLVLDLTNPPGGIGWANQERTGLMQRGPADTVMALALIHHLAISNNLPLEKIAKFFAAICRKLIIEFVPKEDSKVQKLLASREDIFVNYDQANFEAAFGKLFSIDRTERVNGTHRTVYLMQKAGT